MPRQPPGSMAAELRRIRMNRGMTQRQLATAAALSQSLVVQIETGTRNPSADTLAHLADALKATQAEREALETARRRERQLRVAALPDSDGTGTITGLTPVEQRLLEGVLREWRRAGRG